MNNVFLVVNRVTLGETAMCESLAQEFKVIDAIHRERSIMRAEIKLLRIQLKEAKGEKLSLRDIWERSDIVKEFPHLGEVYDVEPIRDV